MPVGYTADADQGVLFVCCWGVFSADDVTALRRALSADQRIEPTWRTLTDLRAVESFEGLDASFIRSYAVVVSDAPRRAVVIDGTLAFGLARMYGSTAVDPDRYGIFQDLPTALAWLGLAEDTPFPALEVRLGAEDEPQTS